VANRAGREDERDAEALPCLSNGASQVDTSRPWDAPAASHIGRGASDGVSVNGDDARRRLASARDEIGEALRD